MYDNYLIYPNIDPIIFQIGPVALRWYGLMYLIGFAFAYWLGTRRAKKSNGLWTVEQVDQLLYNGFFGVILGGRIGDVFFYSFDKLLQDPLYLFRIWEGGMSFHGGLIGVIIAMLWTARRQKHTFWETADFAAPLIPFGLGMGRLGNFINGELWGRTTDVPWAMIFPHVDYQPRHPSQIYEFLLEGVLLFIILNVFIRKPRPLGAVSGLFLLCYGIFRFIVENFREPDMSLTLDLGIITRGQTLSLPMIVLGVLIMVIAYKKRKS
ncbi:prolipoprotein diacylglyceryl transferase [Phocoenobacter skyensis]|uniref:Phosphatidylglycerol--prolipoprotein diacylglyceryl transferase n=1 Tax=Phocoenobacter skyensis TaxID=97481 RepID=A0A1H7V215_9PAST|nr:prolipoprotein diacylglyceryl transferase [Pasteurella skyensis]MDP8078469.1 prolipoprotein diacylglyceryl transferase [Pasteurella skyensis]MDP8084439.1 prolipoprotein diacylglyceryl transferase [Pasteurella skyensis]MDP8184770.1 prolipoprotein diacylglyceryl transferase [Pasteurella skyensis]QLB23239.1 prolipoprotein diacylglyceryl transferase [Pasteurella skyensis]SEM03301.1 phosphatidylglycerol:prolipoprotein diacylglycerol transferase [Pasteurella skyensis]